MSLRDKIENNLTIWLLSSLLTGFLAGIGAYEGILRIAKLKTISKSELDSLKKQSVAKSKPAQIAKSSNLYSDVVSSVDIALFRGSTVLAHTLSKEFNFGAILPMGKNYNERNESILLFIWPPKVANLMLDETDFDISDRIDVWLRLGEREIVTIPPLGNFEIRVSSPLFDESYDKGVMTVAKVNLRVIKLSSSGNDG